MTNHQQQPSNVQQLVDLMHAVDNPVALVESIIKIRPTLGDELPLLTYAYAMGGLMEQPITPEYVALYHGQVEGLKTLLRFAEQLEDYASCQKLLTLIEQIQPAG